METVYKCESCNSTFKKAVDCKKHEGECKLIYALCDILTQAVWLPGRLELCKTWSELDRKVLLNRVMSFCKDHLKETE